MDPVTCGSVGVLGAVHLDEHNLVTILGRKLLHDLIPTVHELDAVAAPGHEKIDHNERVGRRRLNQVLELVGVVCLDAEGVHPPIVVTHSRFLL